MKFEEALPLLRKGIKIRAVTWHNKGYHIYLRNGFIYASWNGKIYESLHSNVLDDWEVYDNAFPISDFCVNSKFMYDGERWTIIQSGYTVFCPFTLPPSAYNEDYRLARSDDGVIASFHINTKVEKIYA